MEIDIIEVTDEQLLNYSEVQMQLLRTAQKNKNKLIKQLAEDKLMYKKVYLANDMGSSSLYTQKCSELEQQYESDLAAIIEQLMYGLQLNRPYPDDEEIENSGYIVDFSLSYAERYNIVRDYYLSIPDAAERMALYAADDVARKYLSSYYNSLYDLLATYSQ